MKSKFTGRIIADKTVKLSSEAKTDLDYLAQKNQTYDQVIRQLILEYKATH